MKTNVNKLVEDADRFAKAVDEYFFKLGSSTIDPLLFTAADLDALYALRGFGIDLDMVV